MEEDPVDVTFKLQLALGIADVKIVNTWPIANEEEVIQFKSQDETFSCWVDPNQVDPPTQFNRIIDERKVVFGNNFIYHLTHINHPKSLKSNPEGSHYLLYALVLPKKCQRGSIVDAIPEGFDSVLDDSGQIRVKSVSQVIFILAIEFQLVTFRQQVPELVCEMCESTLAHWYCPADSAHLCDLCDKQHHASSEILSRHSRLLVSQSPFQFGNCAIHPSEKIHAVCTCCYKSLCPSCESLNSFNDTPKWNKYTLQSTVHQHTLISTTDAYKDALNDSMLYDDLREEINNKHKVLLNLYSNYKSTQDKVDQIAATLLSQLNKHFKRQLDYLDARHRQLKLYSDTLEWLISFIEHVTLSLGCAEFVYLKYKFDRFSEGFLDKISLTVSHPKWLLQPLEFWGGVTIETKNKDQDEEDIEESRADQDYLDKYDLTKPAIPGMNEPPATPTNLANFVRTNQLNGLGDLDTTSGLERLNLYQSRAEDTAKLAMDMSSPKNNASFNFYTHEVASLAPSNAVYNSSQRDFLSPTFASAQALTSKGADATMDMPNQMARETGSEYLFYNESEEVLISPLMVDSLWGLLSEHRFLPLINLLASCDVTKRVGFLEDLSKLANSYKSVHLLIHDYIHYLLGKGTPEFLMLRSVGSLFDIFSWSLIGEPSTTTDWFYTKLSELDRQSESLERCIDKFVFDLSCGHIPESLAWSLYQLPSPKLGTDLIASLSASLVTRMEIGGDDSRQIAYSLSKLGMLIWYGDQNGHLPEMTRRLHKGVERFLRLPKKVVNLLLKSTGDATAVAKSVIEALVALKREVYGEVETGSSQFDVNLDAPNLHEILHLVSQAP